MYNEVVKFAIENEYESISLNNYKEKFLGMYTFCVKEGFVEYKIEFDEFQNATKSMFRKII